MDFFLANDGRLLVNEINTIPGFTNISMFPLLWEASGFNYSDHIDRLITLALSRRIARHADSLRKPVTPETDPAAQGLD